jgi:hypothetical protein
VSDPRIHTDDAPDLHADDVSRAYRTGAREEPSSALDEAVSAAARRAAGSRPGGVARWFGERWSVPLAIAATLVIGVSIAFFALERPDAPEAATANAPLAEAGKAARSTVPPGGSREKEALQPSGELLADATQPAEDPQKQAPDRAVRESRPSRERTTREEMVLRRAQQTELAASQSPGGTPAVSSPAPTLAETLGLQKAVPRLDTQADHEADLLSPEVWLQRIREWRAKGDLVQADASLKAFRRRYPDYPLPADVLSSTDTRP